MSFLVMISHPPIHNSLHSSARIRCFLNHESVSHVIPLAVDSQLHPVNPLQSEALFWQQLTHLQTSMQRAIVPCHVMREFHQIVSFILEIETKGKMGKAGELCEVRDEGFLKETINVI